MITTATDQELRNALIDMMEYQHITLNVEYLTKIDSLVPGATGHQSGFFWVMKDRGNAILRIQRITMKSVDFRDGASDVAVTELSDLTDDVLRSAMEEMLNLAIRAQEEETQRAKLGNYDYSKVTALLGLD